MYIKYINSNSNENIFQIQKYFLDLYHSFKRELRAHIVISCIYPYKLYETNNSKNNILQYLNTFYCIFQSIFFFKYSNMTIQQIIPSS